jgi:hypothetical protein
MYALITENNEIAEIGELQALFPNEPRPSHLYAIQRGAREIIEGHQENQQFYFVTFDKYVVGADSVTRTYVNTPKILEDVTETPEGQTEPITTKGLKSQHIAQFKQTANSLLATTDWMVIRKAERSVDIPAETVAKRAAILAECDRLTAAVTAATDMPSFITAVQSANWS